MIFFFFELDCSQIPTHKFSKYTEEKVVLYFKESEFRRNKTFYFIISKLFVDKCLRLR